MEKILKIEETAFKTNDSFKYPDMDGYKITTDKQEILIGISNGQSCCESWGHFVSEDDYTQFIGANLLNVYETNKELNNKVIDLQKEEMIEDCMFFNIDTSKGTLQFAVYNDHNGYYSHDVMVRSTQFNYEGGL